MTRLRQGFHLRQGFRLRQGSGGQAGGQAGGQDGESGSRGLTKSMNDLRFGLRTLLKQPAFMLVAVATLALGIGANTAIFSVVRGVLLRPLPVPEADRVTVFTAGPSGDVSAPTYLAWRERNRVFQEIAAVHPEDWSLTDFDEPERIRAWVVSPSFFDVVKVEAALGRVFLPTRMDSAVGRTVILGHGFWQRRFGADPGILGQSLRLDGVNHIVVGVMPVDFGFKGSRFGSQYPDLYVRAERGVPKPPIELDGDYTAIRDIQYLIAVGRLRDGISLSQAKSEMDILANALAEEHPDEPEPREVSLAPLPEQLVGTARPALLLLLGAVGFVLLIACANVANLLVARATGREREIAIRATLGASRWRLMRQLLGESVLLSLLGAAAGLVLALWSLEVVVSVSPGNIPRMSEVGIDWTVLGYTLAIALFTGVTFGLLPALHATRPDLYGALKEGVGSAGGLRGKRIRGVLVALEISMALVLLVGAGLMVKSYILLQEVDPGFQPENMLTMKLWLPDSKYDDEPEVTSFFRRVVERIETVPGVLSASASLYAPLDGGRAWMKFVIEGRPETTPDKMPLAAIRVISPNFFRTVGIPLLMGRDVTDRDDADAPKVAVISEAMASRFWPDEMPIGKRISGDGQEWIDVVGVVGDVRHDGLATLPEPTLYVPHAQMPLGFMSLVLRVEADPLNVVDAVRGQIWAVDDELPVYQIRTAEQYVAQSVARPRFHMLLIGAFAAIALLLAVVGIYGLMSFSVGRRVHEVGIRVALGAHGRDVVKLLVRQGAGVTVVGVGIGLVASLSLTRVLGGFLYGVSTADPLTYLGVTMVLTLAAIIASYLPARRAVRVDPLKALRNE